MGNLSCSCFPENIKKDPRSFMVDLSQDSHNYSMNFNKKSTHGTLSQSLNKGYVLDNLELNNNPTIGNKYSTDYY